MIERGGEEKGTDGFSELVGVSAEGVNVPNRSGSSAIAEEHGEGVDAFLVIVVETTRC